MKYSLKLLDSYDWREAFAYAGEPGHHGSPSVSAAKGQDDTDTSSFTIADVKQLIGLVEGENDMSNWLAAGQLHDGRWFFLSAGCDYTGWDCQASGYAIVARTKAHLIRFGIGDEDRSALGLQLKNDEKVIKDFIKEHA